MIEPSRRCTDYINAAHQLIPIGTPEPLLRNLSEAVAQAFNEPSLRPISVNQIGQSVAASSCATKIKTACIKELSAHLEPSENMNTWDIGNLFWLAVQSRAGTIAEARKI